MHLDSFIVSALLLLAATSVAVALFRHLGLGSVLMKVYREMASPVSRI